MYLLPVAAVAVLLWLASRTNLGLQLKRWAQGGASTKVVSILLVVLALMILARGNVWAALGLFGVSLWLLGRAKTGGMARPRQAQTRVRSAFVSLVHDGTSDRITGVVLAGPYGGRTLDTLNEAACLELYGACQRADPSGARFLEPYLDRRFPRWRAAANGNADPGPRRARFTSRISEQEAYQILGLSAGATRDDIIRAHRAAMKKWHPDQGGSVDLAARANEAKEVLLRRHV